MSKNNFVSSEYYEKINSVSVCKTCKKEFKTDRNFNLRTHLEKVHKLVFLNEKENVKKTITKYKTKSVKCDISKKLLIKSYIGLVTDEAVPFNVLNSEHMRNIIDPICKAIEKQSGKKFCLNAHNCKKTLSEVAKNVIKSISNECQNKLISLKMDSATRLSRNIFGISAQFIINDVIESRMLGMVELKGQSSSTSKHLASEVLNVLNKYGINLKQVVSITSDNGANMLKTSKILSHASYEEDEYEESYNNEVYFQNIDAIENNTELNIGDIAVCRCAAHTAQLCALDASKCSEIKAHITNCRNLVKFLKKNSNGYKDLFEIKSLRIPQLDCPTRWGSTYLMVLDLKNSKEILDSVESIQNKSNEENFELNGDFWDFIESYCLVLSPMQKTILKYQEEKLHYGDFYAQWLKCKILTQKILEENCNQKSSLSYKISFCLLESIEKRTRNLLKNNGLTACLYLDPRFNNLLLDEQKKEAVNYLKTIWDKLKSISQVEINEAASSSQQERTTKSDDEDDLLDLFLNDVFQNTTTQNSDVSSKIEQISLPFVKSGTNVLDFWKERRQSDPELYALSNICFAIPPTQVSVERAFSALKLVLAENRNRLSKDTLENILLVKLNPGFLDKAISELDLFADDDVEDE